LFFFVGIFLFFRRFLTQYYLLYHVTLHSCLILPVLPSLFFPSHPIPPILSLQSYTPFLSLLSSLPISPFLSLPSFTPLLSLPPYPSRPIPTVLHLTSYPSRPIPLQVLFPSPPLPSQSLLFLCLLYTTVFDVNIYFDCLKINM